MEKHYTTAEFDALPQEQKDEALKRLAQLQKDQEALEASQKEMPKMKMEDFKAMVEESVKKHIEPLTKVDRKYFAFPGIGKEGLDNITPEAKWDKTIRFFKAIAGGDVQTVRQISDEARKKSNLSEGTTTAGGFTVPDEFSNEVLKLLPTFGVARRECRIIPMNRDILYIPTLNENYINSAHFTAEAGNIYNTDPRFGQVALIINKLAAIPKVTNELLEDSGVNIIQFLSEHVAYCFAKREDHELFLGTGSGTSPFVGVLQATGVPSYTQSGSAFTCLSYQDLVSTIGQLYDDALAGAKFYLHRSMVTHVRSLITTTGAPIFGAIANEIAGYPLVSAEKLPGTAATADATAYGIFGNLRMGVALGERGGLSVKMSDAATVNGDNLFAQDMMAIRFIERYCQAILLPSAFCRIYS